MYTILPHGSDYQSSRASSPCTGKSLKPTMNKHERFDVDFHEIDTPASLEQYFDWNWYKSSLWSVSVYSTAFMFIYADFTKPTHTPDVGNWWSHNCRRNRLCSVLAKLTFLSSNINSETINQISGRSWCALWSMRIKNAIKHYDYPFAPRWAQRARLNVVWYKWYVCQITMGNVIKWNYNQS